MFRTILLNSCRFYASHIVTVNSRGTVNILTVNENNFKVEAFLFLFSTLVDFEGYTNQTL